MADETFRVDLEANVDKAKKDIKGLKDELKTVDTEAKKTGKGMEKSLGGSLGKLGSMMGGFIGSAVSGFGQLAEGVKLGSVAFKGLRAAIISTGIGAIVVAIVAVVTAISRLQSVQDSYKQATAGLQVIMARLGDLLAYLGEALITLFTEPQQALDAMTTGVQNLWNWYKTLWSIVGGVLILGFLKFKESVLDTAAAMKEFFGGDATALREELAATRASIIEVKEELSADMDAVAQPFIDIANAVAEMTEEMGKAAQAASALAKREQNLEKIQIKQIESQARRNLEIARQRLLYEEEGRSLEEREAALQRALDLENQNLQERLANAREEAAIIAQKNALSESTREDERAEAEARAKVLQLERDSLNFQKEVTAQLRGIREQRAAEQQKARDEQLKQLEEYNKAVDEVNKALFESGASDEEKAVQAAADKYDKLLDLAEQYNLDITEIEYARQEEMARIEEEFALKRQEAAAADAQAKTDAELQANQEIEQNEATLQQAKFDLANAGIGAIEALSAAFFQGDEKRAKKAFQVTKAMRIAEATASTYAAAAKTLADPSIPTPAVPFAVAGIIASGLTNVAQIAATKFSASGGGGGGGGGSAPSFGGAGQSAPPPAFGGLQQPENNQQSIQAYVIEQNVTNSQQANQRIKEVSAL